MRYRVLGGLAVWTGCEWSQIGAAKHRALLAVLLVNANRFVSADRLIHELWGERAPDSAPKSLQVYVYRLRRAIGAGSACLMTRPGGYELSVGEDEVDADRFAKLVRQGRHALAEQRATDAVRTLTEALSLWHGEALADVPPTPTVLAEAARLQECRLAAWETLADAKLAAGRHVELIADLRVLVAEQPLRESLWAKLMVALHRSGRRSDALTAYARARKVLLDEVGVPPGGQLRRTYDLILDDDDPFRGDEDAALDDGAAPAPPPAQPPAVPAAPNGPPTTPAYQLPARVPDFVGRETELIRTRQLLSEPVTDGRHGARTVAHSGLGARTVAHSGLGARSVGDSGPGARTVVVVGAAGIGKTAFAAQVAHLVRDAYPDGQLFAELRTADNRPVEPAEVLASLLKTLGVTGAEIPEGLAERAQRYRTELATRRVLVVIDNAVDERQVRPLLPGTGDSVALVTSRTTLAGLEAAARVVLDVLPDPEALALLAAAADYRTSREPDAARRLVRLCGNLPLALRIAGARLATRRYPSASGLADTLDDERRRLDELVAGDLEVRSSVALSYEALDPAAQRAFRLLGVLNIQTMPGWVIGALLSCPQSEAERVTNTLVDNHLLEFDCVGAADEPRYRLHDLIRLFAQERAGAEEAAPERDAALARVCDVYTAVALRANQRLGAGFLGPVPGIPAGWQPRHTEVERLTAAPLRWLDAERTTMCALLRQASAEAKPAHQAYSGGEARPETAAGLAAVAWRLTATLASYFEIGTHFDDWRDTHTAALGAARRAGDRLGEAVLYRNLGELDTIVDRYEEAVTSFEAALLAYRDAAVAGAPRQPGETATAAGLGVLLRLLGRYQEASSWLDRAIVSARVDADPRAESYARRGKVSLHLERGELDRAGQEAAHALFLSEQEGYRAGEAAAHLSAGLVHLAGGALAPAVEQFEMAVALAVAVGDRAGEIHGQHWLGHVADVTGEPDRAEELLDRCLSAYRRYGERFGEALTLRSLGDLYLHTGRTVLALAAVEQSLDIWARLLSPYWTARTLDLVVAISDTSGRRDVADKADRAAAALRARIGLPNDLRAVVVGGRALGGHLRPAGKQYGALRLAA